MSWDNPIDAPDGMVWVVSSYELNDSDKPLQSSRIPCCFQCGKPLPDACVTLAFGGEGPWSLCRPCIRNAAAGLKFVAEADW